MKLTKETVKQIADIFWCHSHNDDLDEHAMLVRLLEKIDLVFVQGNPSQSLLQLRETDDPSTYSPGYSD